MPPEPQIIAPAYSFKLDEYLEAWGAVQSGNDDDAEGSHGELGRYQIKPALWKKYCEVPFNMAVHRANSRVVIIRVICDYIIQARSNGCDERMLPEVVTFWLACGRHATVANSFKRDEIQRVLNLYESTK